jgi:hypothetical protein
VEGLQSSVLTRPESVKRFIFWLRPAQFLLTLSLESRYCNAEMIHFLQIPVESGARIQRHSTLGFKPGRETKPSNDHVCQDHARIIAMHCDHLTYECLKCGNRWTLL